ncbi:MAG TPA: class I SAM-dependent methyltransferase family protein [Thermoprotei archaeon]|nr:class I SAM-dependent methyltransferase family protein [Thermoprotei archaeon]
MIKSFDIIGDIAIIKIPEKILDERRYRFGEEILKNLGYIKVVLRQTTPVEGIYRLRKFEYLAGERRTETVYKEYGARFYVDISKVYFTPRLSYERIRVANLVGEGEKVLNMFAGAGPFTIHIARKGGYVYSIDINPYAIEYHYINNIINKVDDKVILFRDDASRVVEEYLVAKADRVIMPLPELALDYLKYALKALREEGVLHIYLHIQYQENDDEALEKGEYIIWDKLSQYNVDILDINSRVVREVSTRMAQVCIDVTLHKNINYI